MASYERKADSKYVRWYSILPNIPWTPFAGCQMKDARTEGQVPTEAMESTFTSIKNDAEVPAVVAQKCSLVRSNGRHSRTDVDIPRRLPNDRRPLSYSFRRDTAHQSWHRALADNAECHFAHGTNGGVNVQKAPFLALEASAWSCTISLGSL